LLFILTLVILSQCETETGPNFVSIPDNNFLNALIELGVDTNEDGKISKAEAEAITYLKINDSISDMTGIEAFVKLDSFDCSNNQLTTLDVSNCTALSILFCHNNNSFKNENLLTTLDISAFLI